LDARGKEQGHQRAAQDSNKDDASLFTEPVEDLAEHKAHGNQYRGPKVNVHAASFARSPCQRIAGPRLIPPSPIHWLVIDGEMIGAVPLIPADGGIPN
jgi:hypothetical protein